METTDHKADHAFLLIKTSKLTFIISFLIGTGLLITYVATNEFNIAIVGFYYVIAALFFNLIVLINNVICMYTHNAYRKMLLYSSLLLLLNIPIAIFYFGIVINI